MNINFSDVEDAFYFVSTSPQFTNSAILSKGTGQIYFLSDLGESDDLPDDIDESGQFIEIPHKNDLGLGRRLVSEFVCHRLPEHSVEVERIFRHKGAYSRFKAMLESKGLLDEWHEFENTRTTSQGCQERAPNFSR